MSPLIGNTQISINKEAFIIRGRAVLGGGVEITGCSFVGITGGIGFSHGNRGCDTRVGKIYL